MAVERDHSIGLSPDECEKYSHALADVLCWLSGFQAARADAELPPGREALRDLNILLKTGF